MNVNLAALLYLVSGVSVHFRPARPVASHDIAPGQSVRHDRHGDRHRHDARLALAVRFRRLAAGDLRPGSRRRLRRAAGAPDRNDQDAAARGLLPLAGRPRRRAGGGGRAVCARGFRHRHRSRNPRGQPDRNVARRGHRRDHLHGFDHRLPEARRPHVGQADHVAAAPPDQYRASPRVWSCSWPVSTARARPSCSC